MFVSSRLLSCLSSFLNLTEVSPKFSKLFFPNFPFPSALRSNQLDGKVMLDLIWNILADDITIDLSDNPKLGVQGLSLLLLELRHIYALQKKAEAKAEEESRPGSALSQRSGAPSSGVGSPRLSSRSKLAPGGTMNFEELLPNTRKNAVVSADPTAWKKGLGAHRQNPPGTWENCVLIYRGCIQNPAVRDWSTKAHRQLVAIRGELKQRFGIVVDVDPDMVGRTRPVSVKGALNASKQKERESVGGAKRGSQPPDVRLSNGPGEFNATGFAPRKSQLRAEAEARETSVSVSAAEDSGQEQPRSRNGSKEASIGDVGGGGSGN